MVYGFMVRHSRADTRIDLALPPSHSPALPPTPPRSLPCQPLLQAPGSLKQDPNQMFQYAGIFVFGFFGSAAVKALAPYAPWNN